MEVLVEYDYEAQNPDELNIKKGDRIRNVIVKEEGWYEGELVPTGRRGVFPDNFVKPIKQGLIAKTLGFNTNKSPDDKKKNFINNTIGSVINNGSNNNNSGKFQQPVQTQSPPPPPPPSSAGQDKQQLQPQPPQQPQQQSHQPIIALKTKLINQQSQPPPLPTKQSDHFTARVVYSYVPVNEDELSIQENDIVQVLRLVEDGWFEGIHNGKRGVFPSNYVEKINDPPANLINETTKSSESLNTSLVIDNHNSSNDFIDEKKKNKKVLGIGFGNIFSGKQIELKTKENFNINSSSKQELNNNSNNNINTSPVLATHHQKRICKARVVYDYEPTQPDELKLSTGEIIYILDKHLEDEGWWKGESISSGRIGVFPDNFVKELDEPILTHNGVIRKKQNNIMNLNSSSQSQLQNKIALQNDSPNLNSLGSSSSASSSSNSLQREEKRNSIKSASQHQIQPQQQQLQQQQPALVQTPQHHHNHQQQQQQISSSLEDNNSKSQSDMSEDLDEMQKSDRNKLTHIKKTRQFNKRPPSFRNKPNKNDDEEELLIKAPNTLPLNGTNGKDLTSSSQNKLFQASTPQSPKSPTHSLSAMSNLVSQSNLSDEILNLKQELDIVKKNSSQIHNEYKSVQNELNDVKKSHDEQMKKMQKRLNDLITEIDEEKKTRLALQVELERLKKTIMSNN